VGIFMLNAFQFGGIERVVSLLTNELINTEKYEIEIISLFKTNKSPFFSLDERIRVSNIFEKPFDLRKNFVKAVRGSRKFAKNNKFDVLITAGMGYVPFTWLAFRNTRHISWEHSNISIGNKFGITWLGRQIAYRYMNDIVVLTKRDLNNYKKQFPKVKNIKQIYNPAEYEISKSDYNVESKKILSCGRLAHQKGFDILIDVAKKVLYENPDWQWDIYGDGEDRPALEKKISDNKLEDKVVLKGSVKSMRGIYERYSLFVLTSRYEGFGLVITEAQSYKLPVVSFNCNCGPDELIEHNVNGYLIDNFDLNEMARKISDLIKDKEKRMMFSSETSLKKDKLKIEVFKNKWENLIDNKMEE
jgi:glycosyltransferase involved in cell wall biosynthesis